MRDMGFDFEWYDKYCTNLFAKKFEKKIEHYDIVTAFEFLEHLPNPLNEFSTLMKLGDTIICSTELLPNPVPNISDWWYYSPNGGQHIMFYTRKSLEIIAAGFNRTYYNYGNLHIFSKHELSKISLRVAGRFPGLVNRVIRRESLLKDDYKMITGKALE